MLVLNFITARMSAAVICTGPGLVRQVEATSPTTRTFHIFDIPSSLVEFEDHKVAAVNKELQKSEDDVFITFVGSFALYQGVELMFAAIPLVAAQCPQARFLIIGGGQAEIETLETEFKAQGLEQRVSFLGKIDPDALPNYLRASDILLSPRASGVNSPLKILDYMKAGRAIVATDIPSNRLVLSDENAILTAPNPDGFSRGISQLVDDKRKRQQMGAANYELYRNKYNFAHYRELMASCYASVLEKDYQFKIGKCTRKKKPLLPRLAKAFSLI